MMTKDEVIGVLGDAVDSFDRELGGILAHIGDPEERLDILSRRDALRDIYYRAMIADLRDFNRTVQVLFNELKAVQARMKAALKQFKDTAELLVLVTEVIKLAGAIVTAAAV